MAECPLNIDFRNIPSIPLMIKDYMNGNLNQYFGFQFNKENALKQARDKAKSYTTQNRKLLTGVLSKQMKTVEISVKQQQNLDLLALPDTFTVTTGHQLNLFTGPAFFIYKILQTIKTAEFLNENEEGKKFVPVFWMATEDHDFLEINHFKTENNFYQTEEITGDAVGRMVITDNSFIKEFENEFKGYVYGVELIHWIKEAYRIGYTFAKATRILVNRLFAEYGLLILDGDNRYLKPEVSSIFKQELESQKLFHSTKGTVESLISQYGKVQVNPREINLFYLHNQYRSRIEGFGDLYKIVDTEITFTREEILNELEHHPDRFSPNAILRPAYQEAILPNIIYIGGNAEIMYWLELKEFFNEIKVPYPILIPRNSFAFLSEKTKKKMQKLNICTEDIFGNYQEVVHERLLHNTSLSKVLDEKEEVMKSIFQELKVKAKETDKTFENLLSAQETRQLKGFSKMKKRLLRAEKIVQGDLYQRYNELYEIINPGGVWQERRINFSPFYAEYGRKWFNDCYQNINVEHSELIVLVL